MLQRRQTKIRKVLIRYRQEILNLKNSGMSLRMISKEMQKRHNFKISFNYISEILSDKKINKH